MSFDLDKFGKFTRKWVKCKACPLHEHAKKHVLFRGSIPADILFVGEAPGKTEDKLGKPFVGPSGDLLEDTLNKLHLNERYCITNVVCCIPWAIIGKEIRQPSPAEAEACKNHIAELVGFVRPKLIISLGEVAKKLMAGHQVFYHINRGASISSPGKDEVIEVRHLRHPAYVLHKGGKDSQEHKLMILQLQRYCEEFEIGHEPYFTEQSYSKSVTNASLESRENKALRSKGRSPESVRPLLPGRSVPRSGNKGTKKDRRDSS